MCNNTNSMTKSIIIEICTTEDTHDKFKHLASNVSNYVNRDVMAGELLDAMLSYFEITDSDHELIHVLDGDK